MKKYPEGYPLWVLQKVAVTPCTNPSHKTAVEIRNPLIVPGFDTFVLCADCCVETEAREARTQ